MSSEWPAPFQPVGPPPPPPVRAGRSPLEYFLAGGIVVGVIVVLAIVGMMALNACPNCPPSPTASPPTSPTQIAGVSPTPATSAATGTPDTSPSAPTNPTLRPSQSPGSSPAPLRTPPPEIAAQIAAVVAQMPAIRDLEPLRDVPNYMISREQFRADLEVLVDQEIDRDLLAAQERLLKRMGLLPAGADLRQLVLDLNGGAVAAFYRPDTGAFYVIERNEPFGALDRVYVAHEYTHALQDQHFDLEGTRITDPSEGDAALAQLAVIEGDATDAMIQWAQRNLSFEELLDMLSSSLNGTDQQTLDNMPLILSRQLTFPYEDGLNFVTPLQESGGWAAVDGALQHPPASTEQILHPEKYTAHEAPVSVALADPSQQLGAGWEQAYVDTLGELNIQIFAAGDERPAQVLPGMPGGEWPHADAAAGWGGDRIYMWEGPDDAWAIGWITAWDTAADADEFGQRVGDLQSRFGGPAHVTRGGTVDASRPETVTIIVGSDDATLQRAEAVLH